MPPATPAQINISKLGTIIKGHRQRSESSLSETEERQGLYPGTMFLCSCISVSVLPCPSSAPPPSARCRLQQWPGAKCKLSLYKMQVNAAIASNHNNHSSAAPFIGVTLSSTAPCNPGKVVISAPRAETRIVPTPGHGHTEVRKCTVFINLEAKNPMVF